MTLDLATLSRRQIAALDAIVHDIGVRSADAPDQADVLGAVNVVLEGGGPGVQQTSILRRMLGDSPAINLRMLLGGEEAVEQFLDRLVGVAPAFVQAATNVVMDLRLDPGLVRGWGIEVPRAPHA